MSDHLSTPSLRRKGCIGWWYYNRIRVVLKVITIISTSVFYNVLLVKITNYYYSYLHFKLKLYGDPWVTRRFICPRVPLKIRLL